MTHRTSGRICADKQRKTHIRQRVTRHEPNIGPPDRDDRSQDQPLIDRSSGCDPTDFVAEHSLRRPSAGRRSQSFASIRGPVDPGSRRQHTECPGPDRTVHGAGHGDRFTVDAHGDRRWVGADDDLRPGICQRFDRALAAFRGDPRSAPPARRGARSREALETSRRRRGPMPGPPR
jgi:hypothetical protein